MVLEQIQLGLARLPKRLLWATLVICINSTWRLSTSFTIILQPVILALCVVRILGVFGYVESISDVNFSVQCQGQMLMLRLMSTLTYRWTITEYFC